MSCLDEERKIIDEIDGKMAELFEKRMEAVKKIAEYKKRNGLEIYCKDRENEIISKSPDRICDKRLIKYYTDFLIGITEISKEYQKDIFDEI